MDTSDNFLTDFSAEEIDALLEQWQEVLDRLKAAWFAWVEAMRPVYQAIKEWCAAFVDMARKQYRIAGAPYGDTDEGMWQWLREQTE